MANTVLYSLRHLPVVTKSAVLATLSLSLTVLIAQLYQHPTPVSGQDDAPTRDALLTIETVKSYLVLYPGLILTRPWTLVLTGWIETNALLLLSYLVILTLVGTYLEKRWGWLEFAKFIAVVNLTAVASTFLIYVFIFAGSRNIGYLYDVCINGQFGLVSGFTVALKQSIPEHRVTLYHPMLSFRVKYLTLIYATVVGIVLLLTRSYPYLYLLIAGTFASWLYLRFVKDHNGVQGDYSDAFTFATFFPDWVQPPIAWVAGHVFHLFVVLRLLRPLPAYQPLAVGSQDAATAPEIVVDVMDDEDPDAKRRK
ncbi:hypothetical protein IWQ60_008167 [Tieghemiomyces parasiticus]|uniref:Uncharacterized protein n=1 Tax=Tieghemiomyces parasiticus TaxID=78921 RepID=A0A9W7ZTF0_9FUNG|nr:hypothetical protein IWQ60_008167 [Tieghemiomyces parasiticus]